MGNVKFNVNIDGAFLFASLGVFAVVVLIAVLVFLWTNRSGRQVKAIENIDKTLSQKILIENSPSNEEISKEDYSYGLNIDDFVNENSIFVGRASRNKKDNIEEIEHIEDDCQEEIIITKVQGADIDTIDDKEELQEEVKEEIMSEVNNKEEEFPIDLGSLVMSRAQELQQAKNNDRQDYNVGQSGRVYTKEELEKLIMD